MVKLTLEAVAVEAGISKASVLYDYKTKQGLIRAMIERLVSTENERIQGFIDGLGDTPDAPIRGFLAARRLSISDDERAFAVTLCAALAQDAELREPVQVSYQTRIAEIQRSTHPRGAQLAFLAVEGLMLMEWFGLHSWTDSERASLVADMTWLTAQNPARSAEQVASPDDTDTAAD